MSAGAAMALPLFSPTFSKSFGAPTATVGATVSLQFTISNPSPIPILGIGFTDTLTGGLTATGAVNGSCASGTILASGTTVSLTNLLLLPSESCSFSVDVIGATPGVV